MIVDVLVFLTIFLLFIYYRGTRNYKKYKNRGIAQAEPTWPFGSKHNWSLLTSDKVGFSTLYSVFIGTPLEKEKIFGVYGHPENGDALVINDIDIAKKMLIKDFDHFVDRTKFGLEFNEKEESDMVFAHSFMMQKGNDWKTNRNLMTPVFTTGKLKLMYHLLEQCGKQLEDHVLKCSEKNEEIDAKDLFSKFALDGIATSGFGIDLNSFEDPDNTFRRMVNELMRAPGTKYASTYEMTKLVLKGIIPALQYIVSIPNFSPEGALFLKQSLQKTIKHRESSKTKRNDIIDLIVDQIDNKKANENEVEFESKFEEDSMLDMSDIKDSTDKLDKEKYLVSNAFLLFVAALDTTSSTLTFIIHFFLQRPEVQELAREEILDIVGTDKRPSFEQIQDLKYLDKVIYETLRHYHAFPQIIERTCTKDYKIPDTEYVVRKGEIVNFTFLYERMKRDNEHFYNAGEYDPENFDPSNDPDLFSFLGFGQGPRNCVGKRYAMISIKIALVSILRKFRLEKTENTKDKMKQFKFLNGADVPFKAVPLHDHEE